jgi:hypothetical protein
MTSAQRSTPPLFGDAVWISHRNAFCAVIFRLEPAQQEPTSYGEDSFRRVFGVAPHSHVGHEPVRAGRLIGSRGPLSLRRPQRTPSDNRNRHPDGRVTESHCGRNHGIKQAGHDRRDQVTSCLDRSQRAEPGAAQPIW